MKTNQPALLLVLCLPACLAQVIEKSAAPKVLMIVQEQIKEGREAAHARAEEAWPRIFREGHVKANYYIGMTSESGPSEAWFLEPYDSFAIMEKARGEVQRAFAEPLEAANVRDGELRTGSRTLLSVFRPDLSYRAADAMTSLPKCRHMSVTLLRAKYGRETDLTPVARLIIEGYEKSSSDQPVLAYQVISGAPSGTYLLFSPMKTLESLDNVGARTAAARQAMGDHNRQRFESLAAEVVQSSESMLFSFNPKMSYVAPEFAAGDPDYWNPKPVAKSAAKTKNRRPGNEQ